MEKEALALTSAAEKFDEYICGLRCTFETDHKPLVALLGLQQLDQLPLRIQRFRLRLMRYDYDVTYVPGASMTIADALSRSPLKDTTSSLTADEVSAFVRGGIEAIPDSDKLLDRIREFQKKYEVCSTIREYCKTGWPPKGRINQALRPYYEQMAKLSVCEDVLLCGQRIVIPMCLREEILGRIHEGHQGIVRCRQKAKESIWWPGISKELADLVRACSVCEEYRLQPSEPMIPTETPPLPWEKVGVDLFHLGGIEYVLAVDYRSRYPEVLPLSNDWSSRAVILRLKSIFARHGISREVVTDNGPQFASE
ncbi:uncharacterized protein K02A2.6-like [Ornithodoros turicata]|uniref:uncharacterized protein K02A2.6-like n=1 Tax=Ornithodoros turicata TaxID=34597 RepID=UPI00313A22E0